MTQNNTTWQQEVFLPVGFQDEDSGEVIQKATLNKMTGNEEAIIADPKFRNNGGKMITALLASSVTALDEGNKANESIIRRLSSADRNYLLLELRRLTFGDEMEAHYRCSHCQGVTVIMEDLSSIDIRRLEEGKTMPEIRVTLQDGYKDPDGNWQYECVFRLPTGEDEESAGNRQDNPARQRDALLARCLEQIGDLEARRIRAMGIRILASLSMSDRLLIQKTLEEGALGPDLTRSVYCDQCGREYRTSLDMSHFFPLA
jgi:hypothetical protein